MTTDTAIEDSGILLGEGWRDRIEAGVRGRIRGFIEKMLEAEPLQALGRERYVQGGPRRGEREAHARGHAAHGDCVLQDQGAWGSQFTGDTQLERSDDLTGPGERRGLALRVLNAPRLAAGGWMTVFCELLVAELEPPGRNSPTGSPGSPTSVWR